MGTFLGIAAAAALACSAATRPIVVYHIHTGYARHQVAHHSAPQHLAGNQNFRNEVLSH
jgi:hypothetical protein